MLLPHPGSQKCVFDECQPSVLAAPKKQGKPGQKGSGSGAKGKGAAGKKKPRAGGGPLSLRPLLPASPPSKADPNVIAATYNIGGVKVTGSEKNRQAVTEFQGQLMNSKDLAVLFKTYVEDYKVGSDDTVFAYKGATHKEGTTASKPSLISSTLWVSDGYHSSPPASRRSRKLPLAYPISPPPPSPGQAVGIKTEFWEFPANDFCNDLNQWTSNLTSSADVPLVHSVSYGWQGNLSQVGCKPADLAVVDANFAKLAAKGISLMISSGDSGSGYSAKNTQCQKPEGGGSSGTELVGDVSLTSEEYGVLECCDHADQKSAAGWTFIPASALTADAGAPFKYSFKDAAFHTEIDIHITSKSKVFISRDIDILNGDLTAAGGTVTAKNSNGTFTDVTTFAAVKPVSKGSAESEAAFTATISGKVSR
jgi:hypothetical protein